MDFFAHQESARRRSGWLVFLFAAAVVLTIFAVYAVIAAVLAGTADPEVRPPPSAWNPGLFVLVALGLAAVIGGGSLFKIAALAGGGESVARMLGARRVPPQSVNPDERKYLNIVEEMALASGIPPPPAYVIDGEGGINAFAAGYRPDAAVVCVTEGALRRLTRDELQGVVAHEFSHIFNGDMRLNIKIIGVLHGLLLIALIGHGILRSVRLGGGRRRSRDSGKGIALVFLVGLAFLVIGSIGVFFGRLIQAAVSRQREFLADAAAVQFTRNPLGLAGALRKIASPEIGSTVACAGSVELSHLFFANGLRGGLFSLFATHPPIAERIRRLDASLAAETGPGAGAPAPDAAGPVSALASPPRLPTGVRFPAAPPPLPAAAAAAVRAAVGAPWTAHLAAVRERLEALPSAVREAARDPAGAQALVCALLFDRDRREVFDLQRRHLGDVAGAAFADAAAGLAPALDAVPEGMRLAVLDLAVPALRTLSAEDFAALMRDVDALISADDTITLFEYAASRILRRARDAGGARRPAGAHAAAGSGPEISCLLSAMAYAGQADAADAAGAFERARGRAPRGVRLELLPPAQCDLVRIDGALRAMERLAPSAQRWVLDAALECLSHNGRVEPREADLFRAIAAAMDCPVPLAAA